MEMQIYSLGLLISLTMVGFAMGFLKIIKILDDVGKKHDRLITILSDWQRKI